MVKKCKIQNLNQNTAEIFFYGIIGRYMDIDTNGLIKELESLKNQGIKNLIFYVNSDGGEVPQGIALFQYLERSGFNVEWIIDGIAASMAFMVMFNKGAKRKCARYSKGLIHKVSGAVWGNSDEMRNYAETMDKWENDLVNILSENTGMDEKKVRDKWFDGQDHTLTAKEMLEYGLVDEIIDLRDGIEPAPDNLTRLEVYNYYNRIFNQNSNNDMKNITRFITAFAQVQNLSLQESADEDAIFSATQTVVNRCIKAETDLSAKEKEIDNLKKQIEANKDAEIKNLVDQAINSKKFGEDMRETYTNLAKKDLEGTQKIIANLKAPKNIAEQINNNGGQDDKHKDWDWDKYQKEDPKALLNMKTGDPEKFKELFKAKYNKEPLM